MSENGSQRQGETPQEPTLERGNTEICELPALGLMLGSTFGWQSNVMEGQIESQVSDTKIAENWEDPEGDKSSVGESDVQDDWEEKSQLICTEYGMTKPSSSSLSRKSDKDCGQVRRQPPITVSKR